MYSKNITNQFIITTLLSLVAAGLFIYFLDIRFVSAMIAVHVLLGSLAFIVGALSVMAKKGSKLHKLTGKLFYLFMTVSATFTLIVATVPEHFSTSMFQISVMTLYFLIGGVRSLSFKKAEHNNGLDKVLIYATILVSVFILFYAKHLYGGFQPLQTVFGFVPVGFCLVDIWIFSKTGLAKKRWLVLHLSKMLAGYTTAVTGFFVAQKILGGYYDWFTPTAIVLAVIFYWLIKLKVINIKWLTLKSSNEIPNL